MSGNWYDDGDQYRGDKYVGPSKYDYVVKECKRCGRKVEMSSDHGTCDSCASEMERGWEY
jgi:rRNA maturation endonuclease Nob1